MGKIYAICGCSGVGKTTFVNALFLVRPDNLVLLVRTTSRSKRTGEIPGVDYNYLEREKFYEHIFENKFVHVESYDNNIYGIEHKIIDQTINSENDGVLITGLFGALKLKLIYGDQIGIVYLHAGPEESITNPKSWLDPQSLHNVEMRRRLTEKLAGGIFSTYELQRSNDDEFIYKRMEANYLDLALANSQLNAGVEIIMIENPRDEIGLAIEQFLDIRKDNKRD